MSKPLETRIYERLTEAFQPEKLEVKNQSHLHAGHAGDDGSGESHFKVIIQCSALNNLSYVNRERSIHKALEAEMLLIHALSIKFIA
jgi:BolA protein